VTILAVGKIPVVPTVNDSGVTCDVIAELKSCPYEVRKLFFQGDEAEDICKSQFNFIVKTKCPIRQYSQTNDNLLHKFSRL